MFSPPDIQPSPSWQTAWEGFELHQRSLGRSFKSIRNRRTNVLIMARHLTWVGITDPEQVTRAILTSYLLEQYEGRKGAGNAALYQDLKCFWDWFAGEYEVPSPIGKIPRPKCESRPVAVLEPEHIKSILSSCQGLDEKATARNLAIVWLLLETGLRRFELTALNVEDVDIKARTVVVRRGKNGRARVAVFGDAAAQALWRYERRRRTTEGALFLNYRGERLTDTGLRQLVAKISARAGVTVRPHMFRHSWTHYSLAGGMREHDIMKLAGWSSSKMLGRYGASLAQERAVAAGLSIQVGNVVRGA